MCPHAVYLFNVLRHEAHPNDGTHDARPAATPVKQEPILPTRGDLFSLENITLSSDYELRATSVSLMHQVYRLVEKDRLSLTLAIEGHERV